MWSWDITYLKSPVRGVFWYLYLIMDIWSRRIMGWAVHRTQRDAHAATLCTTVCHEHAVTAAGLTLHADNGGPMKGATMLATLERLGVFPSFSRPRVSDDHPYSEALFRTLKYCPAFPTQPFVDLEAARAHHPERWRGNTRDWSRTTTVYVNDARSATADVVAG